MINDIRYAFEHPVNFPPLNQVVYSGDRVTIAPDPFVVSRPPLLADFVMQIVECGVTPENLSIILLEIEVKMFEKHLRESFKRDYRDKINIVAHCANEPTDLAMFAVAKDDSAIKLNRVLVDADVIIPIERYEAALGMGYFGIQSVLYPRFADMETQKRFLYTEAKKDADKRLIQLADEIAEVVQFLGTQLTVQIITDFDNRIKQILYGETVSIKKQLGQMRKTERKS